MANEQKIWDYLLKYIGNEYGVAGLMGNIQAESGCRSDNLQDSFNKSLNMSDAEYVRAIDSGAYSKEQYIRDSAGFGLVQWTFWSLKRDMYEYVKQKKGKSIADLDAQLEFLVVELQSKDFIGVWKVLQSATSVRQASDVVLVQFENPADKSQEQKDKRCKYGEEFYNRFAKGNSVKADSSLVDCVILSPNKTTPRQNAIKKITIHHMAGNLSIEDCGRLFADPNRQGSSNYGIGTDGRVGQYVMEKDRAWTSGSPSNDHQAITIEVANCKGAPNWEVSDMAYNKLIDLCVDICKRNNIKSLNWTGDANGNLTCHYMFQATACPGPYLKSKMPDIANAVNLKLGVAPTPTPTPSKKITTMQTAYCTDQTLRGSYMCTCDLNLRWGADADLYESQVVMPEKTVVNNFSYYNTNKGVKWLYVTTMVAGIAYTGYCCMNYLKKL